MEAGATIIQTKSGHADGGADNAVRRSFPGRPRVRPFLVHGQRSRTSASRYT